MPASARPRCSWSCRFVRMTAYFWARWARRSIWTAGAETPRAEAVREAGVLRFRTVLLLIALLLGVGLLAFIAGAFITGPFERLSEAAGRVAAGDLSVELPAGGSGEVGYLTRAFNTL